MSEADGGPTKGLTRTRIIQQAQQECFEARDAYARAAATSADDAQMAAAAADLHNAVAKYYQALKPLRSDPNIDDDWDEVVLWTEEVPARDENDNLQFVENGDGTTSIAMTETEVGLEGIERYIGAYSERTETTTGFLGTYETRATEPERLSPTVLLNAADHLDELAADLGFSPDTDDVLEEDYI